MILLGVIYAALISYIGKGIPCIFYTLTGFKCPGCGISRMFVCLFKGDFIGAWHNNPVILALLLPMLAVAGDIIFRYVKSGTRLPHKWATVLIYIMIVILLIFGIVRNF